ncbi:MAG: hypothetical protein RR396_05200, partial [Clostridiales bacterium]
MQKVFSSNKIAKCKRQSKEHIGHSKFSKRLNRLVDKHSFHIMLTPGMVITFLFMYVPIFGIIMAFQKFSPVRGFINSPWVGLYNFEVLFKQDLFIRTIRNTLVISFAKIILGVIAPVVLALLLNEMMNLKVKKFVQTTLLTPYFLSWAVLAGVLVSVFSADGPINELLKNMGQERVDFLTNNVKFPILIILSDVWKNMGMNLVIFLAAIANIDS